MTRGRSAFVLGALVVCPSLDVLIFAGVRKKHLTETKLHVFMPSAMRDEIERLAREADRPVAREVRLAIREHIERDRQQEATR